MIWLIDYKDIWETEENKNILRNFELMIIENLPFTDRIKYKDLYWKLQIPISVRMKASGNLKVTFNDILANYLTFDLWEDKIKVLNVFMGTTVEGLKQQEDKFNDLYSNEPELKLSEKEFQNILKSMQRLNSTK